MLLQKTAIELAWGSIWVRPDLDRKTRSARAAHQLQAMIGRPGSGRLIGAPYHRKQTVALVKLLAGDTHRGAHRARLCGRRAE